MKSIPSTHSLIRLALLAFVLRALYFFQHMGSPFLEIHCSTNTIMTWLPANSRGQVAT